MEETMLSARTHAEIDRVTAEVLATIERQEVIERITVVRAYQYLSETYPNRTDYEDRLTKAVRDLRRLFQRNSTLALAVAVEALYDTIIRDRFSESLSANKTTSAIAR